jgi:L-ascorbate metabolism protein UlaG (beta-lactamase superfamily)
MKIKIFTALIIFISLVMTAACTSSKTTPASIPTLPQATDTQSFTPTSLPTNPTGPITLQYIGHSCTLITAPDGTRIISDPYGSNHPSGLASFPNNLSADVVLVSHFHPDHDNVSAVSGKPKTLIDPGTYQVGMVKITGLKGDHGLVNGKTEMDNTVFVFEIGQVKIVHLGAAGVVTQNEILSAMENADVVIMDIMGDAAHPLTDELNQLVALHVRTIIPTHYSFEGEPRYYGSATLAEFLQIVPTTLPIVKQGSTFQITANMPQQIIVLAPAANGNK